MQLCGINTFMTVYSAVNTYYQPTRTLYDDPVYQMSCTLFEGSVSAQCYCPASITHQQPGIAMSAQFDISHGSICLPSGLESIMNSFSLTASLLV